MDKNFYNEASASKLGWDPSWFGSKYFRSFFFSFFEAAFPAPEELASLLKQIYIFVGST